MLFTRNKKWFEKLAVKVALTGSTCLGGYLFLQACGTNMFSAVSQNKETKKSHLEEARVKLDNKDYAAASALLTDEVADSDTDSNDARLLLAAAKIGESGMDIWSIVNTIISTTTAAGSDTAELFNTATNDLLGTGSERLARVEKLAEGIALLQQSPDPAASRVANTTCFLGGMLLAAELVDVQNKVTNLKTALTALSSLNSSEMCTNLDSLTDSFTGIAATATHFSTINEVISECPFLKQSEAAAMLDTLISQMNGLFTNVDKGCASMPACTLGPLCDALMPSCVQDSLGVGDAGAQAGDGVIEGCEIALNCTTGTSCFGS